MAFSTNFETRHTDTFAATGYVHAGILVGLTEMAYARFEPHCGVSKPDHVVAVQRETHAEYFRPLPWTDGATVTVKTMAADSRGFEQRCTVSNAATGDRVAVFMHRYAWLDTRTGRSAPIPQDVQERFLKG